MPAYSLQWNGADVKPGATVTLPGTLRLIIDGWPGGWISDNYDAGYQADYNSRGVFDLKPLAPGEHIIRFNLTKWDGIQTGVIVQAAPAGEPAKPAAQPAATIVKPLSAYHAVHLHIAADEVAAATTVDSLPIVEWTTDKGVTRRGFNAAFVAEDGSQVTRKVNGVVDARYLLPWPAQVALTPLAAGSSLTTLKPGAYSLNGAYTIGGECRWTDVTLVCAPGTVVSYNGPQVHDVYAPAGYIIVGRGYGGPVVTGDRICIRCSDPNGIVEFVNGTYTYDHTLPAGKNPARQDAVHFIAPGDDCTFVGVRARGFNEAWSTYKSRTALIRCSVRQAIAYLNWNAGADTVVYDCDVDDIEIEHVCRGQGWTRWALNSNTFTNARHIDDADPATRDANNDDKGTIVMQDGEYGYAWDNALDGPKGIGPLATGQNGKPGVYTRSLVWDVQRSGTRPLDLHPGLDGFRVVADPVNFLHDDDRGIKNGIVPTGASVPAWCENVRGA